MLLEFQSFSLKIFISNSFHIKASNNRNLSWWVDMTTFFSHRISGIKPAACHWSPTEAGNGFLSCTHACSVASGMSDCVQPYGLLLPTRLLCPWDSPGKNTGVGCHALLQGIFPTQGLNLHLLHCRRILYHWATREAQIPSSDASKFPISQKNRKEKRTDSITLAHLFPQVTFPEGLRLQPKKILCWLKKVCSLLCLTALWEDFVDL